MVASRLNKYSQDPDRPCGYPQELVRPPRGAQEQQRRQQQQRKRHFDPAELLRLPLRPLQARLPVDADDDLPEHGGRSALGQRGRGNVVPVHHSDGKDSPRKLLLHFPGFPEKNDFFFQSQYEQITIGCTMDFAWFPFDHQVKNIKKLKNSCDAMFCLFSTATSC